MSTLGCARGYRGWVHVCEKGCARGFANARDPSTRDTNARVGACSRACKRRRGEGCPRVNTLSVGGGRVQEAGAPRGSGEKGHVWEV